MAGINHDPLDFEHVIGPADHFVAEAAPAAGTGIGENLVDVAQALTNQDHAVTLQGGEDGLTLGSVLNGQRRFGFGVDQFVVAQIVPQPVHALILLDGHRRSRIRRRHRKDGSRKRAPACS